jgi:hypothetical protein
MAPTRHGRMIHRDKRERPEQSHDEAGRLAVE